MTQDELVAALPPGRLPPELIQIAPADLLLCFGLGLIVAALLLTLARPFLDRRPSLRARIRDTRGLPGPERLLAIARILGHLPDGLRQAAYRGTHLPDAEVERAALKARPRRR